MFFEPERRGLDCAILREADAIRELIARDAKLSRIYHRRYTTDNDPPILELMHSAYRAQLLMELAQKRLREGTPDTLLFEYFEEWLPAFVRHYQQSRDHELVLVYATARDRCVDASTLAFLDRYADLCVGAGFSGANGASSTGGMGAASVAWRKWIREHREKIDGVALFGARLGMLVDLNQPKCDAIHHQSPPLYVFLLRMYYLGLLGGNPKRKKVNGGTNGGKKELPSTKRTEQLGNIKRRVPTILCDDFD